MVVDLVRLIKTREPQRSDVLHYHALSVLKHDPKRAATSVSLALALTLLSVACTPTSQNPSPDQTSVSSNLQLDKTKHSQQQLAALNIAMIPSQNSQEQIKQRRLIADYLEEKLGLPINIQTPKEYDTAIDLLVEEKVEMAFLGPFSYVKARQRNPQLEPIVAPIDKRTGRPWYTSVIVTNTQSRIDTLEDLKGKRFSFVSKSSTSGYLVASAHFKTMGINPEQDFTAIEYAGSHNKNVDALASGQVDAVCMNKPTYLKAQKSGKLPSDQYKVLWESDPIPKAPIVINRQLPPQLKIDLQKALIDAPEGLVAVSGAKSAGYTLVQNEDYELIRQLQELLELEPDSDR